MIGARIKQARSDLGMSVKELAKEVGLEPSTIYDLEAGASKSTTKLHRIAEVLKVRVQWLETGRGERYIPGHPKGSNVDASVGMRGKVPLISWVAAGSWHQVHDPYIVGDAEEWLPCPEKHSDRAFALRIRVDSMFNPAGELSFREGDVIFVDPDVRPLNKDCVVVRLEDQETATFKQLVIEERG